MFSFISSIVLISVDKCSDEKASQNDSIFNEDENVDFTSIGQLNYIFWLLACICVCLYGGFLPFNNIASGYLTDTYFKNLPQTQARNMAGFYMAVPFFLSIFCVPAFGFLLDKFGKRVYFALISACTGLLCFILFYLLSPLIPLILLGITYSLFASVIWPSIAIVTKKEYTGLAFGISTSMQNAGLAIFPIIVAAILTHSSNNYQLALIFFLSMMLISIVLCVLLILEDKKRNGILNNLKIEEEKMIIPENVEILSKNSKKQDNISGNNSENGENKLISSKSTKSESLPKSKEEENIPILTE